MINLEDLDLRSLQKECARAISTMEATNNNIYKFNQQAHHDSASWYKSVITWYIDVYGDLPSRAGPGKDVTFILDT